MKLKAWNRKSEMHSRTENMMEFLFPVGIGCLEDLEALVRLDLEALEGIVVVDPDRKILYANSRYGDILGYPSEDLLGRYTHDFIDQADLPFVEEEFNKRREGKHDFYEIEWIKKDGSRVPTMMSPRPIFDSDGNFQGSFSVVTDTGDC